MGTAGWFLIMRVFSDSSFFAVFLLVYFLSIILICALT